MVARTDIAFIMHTIPHLVRMCNYPFAERVLAIDTAPLSGEKTLRPHIGDLDELRGLCRELVGQGVADRIVDIDYSDDYRKKVYKKHLGTSRIENTHNYKGYPVLGSIFCIEECKTDYFLHFDSDMLMYQAPGFNWITKGIEILKSHPEIMYVRPQAGPQGEDKNIYKTRYGAKWDEGGFWRLNEFGSRCFLIGKKRIESLLPLKILWADRQGRIKDRLPRALVNAHNNLTGKGLLGSWEAMVKKGMLEKGFLRADIENNEVWTLHPPKHGKDFVEALPNIMERIEKGEFPPAQAGDYELKVKLWL